MSLRKEQLLLLAVLACAAWIWNGRGDFRVSSRVAPKRLEWEALDSAQVVIAPLSAARASVDAEITVPPSEASPLPPRQLEFPPLASLPITAPPLIPGQGPGVYEQLRIAGVSPVVHEFAAAEPEPEPPAEVVDPEPAEEGVPEAVLRQRHDQIYRVGLRKPFFGNVLDDDKVGLATAPVIDRDVRFERVSRITGKVTGVETIAASDIQRIELADNLENRIELRKLELSDSQESVLGRIAFIGELLEEARQQPWVYAAAEEQARRVAELSPPGAEVGYRWTARVLRAQADLEREWQFYQSLEGPIAESAFRYRAQGEFQARLTLWGDAERSLRKAVELDPTDGRSLAVLADFLLRRGRAGEAAPFAERAVRHANQVRELDDRFVVLRVAVEVALAVGSLDVALELCDRAAVFGGAAERAYLFGAVHYARGELDRAREQFERAAADATTLDAVLGMGLCRLRAGEWDAARRDLQRVADGAPLLRARALAALGLLYERCGHPGEALQALEEAERVDPRDPYVLYLLGRQLRIEGRLSESIEVSQRALAEEDEMIEVLAEIARALIRKSEQPDEDAADLQVRAARYIERLVELDQRRARYLPYVEAQGFVLARIGDVNLARAAFEPGAEQGSDFCELGLALLDYRQQRVTDARDRLAAIAGDPAREAATRDFARSTLQQIDDHASKEQIRDGFEREQLGGLWTSVGALRPAPAGGELVFDGHSGRVGDESVVRRTIRAGDLLRAEVTMRVRGSLATTQLAGLRIGREGRVSDFQVLLGMQRQRPEVYIKDGRPRDDELDEPVPLGDLVGSDLEGPQRLVFEVVPAEDGNRLGLKVYWNDELVAERPVMRQLNARSSWNLEVDLVVRGRPVDVAFDDFRLVRRKELR